VSARKASATCRAEFLCGVLDVAPYRSRAWGLVEGGDLDLAAAIAELARTLSDAAVAAITAEWAHDGIAVAEIQLRRNAAFTAIAHTIIDRLDQGGRP